MPIYEFECDRCKATKEILVLNHHDRTPGNCTCGGTFKRLISHSSFILKGSGWYVTDYARKDNKSDDKKHYGKSLNGNKAGQLEEKKEKKEAKAAS